jgi:hypothetical protein
MCSERQLRIRHKLRSKRCWGHSTITLTLDTYSHVIPGLHAEAAKEMQKLFATQDSELGR